MIRICRKLRVDCSKGPQLITRLIKNAPKMPRIDPTAAPIKRVKLACFKRISKMMMARDNNKPSNPDSQRESPKGR